MGSFDVRKLANDYLVNNNIISLLRFTNLLIASTDNGWLESIAKS